ncbi:hypothetical protein IE077_003125 [Cardiosporidium cionae]|uniref:NADH dehydrogenase [ubiquinone] 1 beta subcomplex subunit 7 n=1 Tax=Cardiosporidium cionae TaxID=476202 RepID=A0ABQ7J951_9APIC|nr:hypothetical protein IE077_003125 [Cardiosporidium cionae]|eukprot:KAF8820486.1 hypothetical protein IE077_003125 [Cardiosporidium cionae]
MRSSQRYPWINDRRPFESLAEGVSEYSNISLSPSITLNSDFSHLLRAHVPEEGFKESSGASTSQWERHLSHHYGLYSPAMASDSLNADDVRLKTNHFANTLELDDPTDPCRLLALQEYQCLQAMQTLVAPQGASKNCVKWFNEWQQCKWDQEKITKGYNFLEDRSAAKHKPYIGAPDFQYS